MRVPSNAVPHSIPPWSPPGPMSVLQMKCPVLASSTTYTPLFSPHATTSRQRPWIRIRMTFGPDPPMSHFPPAACGAHHVTASGWLPHARSHGSCPLTRYDHRGAPVFRSNATMDLRKDPGCSHDSVKTPVAAWHAVTLAGSV